MIQHFFAPRTGPPDGASLVNHRPRHGHTEHDMSTHEHIASAAGILIIGSLWFLVMSL